MKFIGGFQVVGFLGRGGAAKVLKVLLPGHGPAALKLFKPREPLLALVGRETLLQWFQQEAEQLAAMQHPNLVRVLGRGQHQGSPFYLMEHFCQSLAGLLGEDQNPARVCRALHPERCLDIAGQALQGLAALHAAGVVHRDLSPHNLMLGDLGQVKIADLGFSLAHGCGQPLPANLMLGTPFFAAPEQDGHLAQVGPASDLYSLGVIIKRMLTGRLHTGGRPGLARAAPHLGPHWESFLVRLLAPAPQDRFGDATGAASALAGLKRAWQGEQEAACLGQTLPPRAEPARTAAPLRQRGAVIKSSQARREMGLDRLMRPKTRCPDFESGPGPGEVSQPGLGLAWQQAGSPNPLTLDQARVYLAGLNHERPDGPWRLPTMAELLCLAAPPPAHGGLCLAGPFDSRQARIWSADRATACHAWCLNLVGGFAQRQGKHCTAWVRAVRTLG